MVAWVCRSSHREWVTRWRSIAIAGYAEAMELTTVSPKYQVVIPKRIREQFDLTPGQQLQVIALPGRIELVPSRSPAALRGFLSGENSFERESDRL
jgi:AbrB family looped-hinge helix DNA binding protein